MDGKTERVFSEVYNSDVYIEEHDKIQDAPLPPDEPNCEREKIVFGLMVCLTVPTSLILARRSSGRFILSFLGFRSTFAISQIQVLANTLHISLLFPTLFKTLLLRSAVNGPPRRKIS